LRKKLVRFLLKRFLRFDKDQPFIFLSALLAYLGIAIGVTVLIVAMALMNGFDKEFKEKLTVMNYPLTIMPKFYGAVDTEMLQQLQKHFPSLKFSPYVVSSIIVKSGSRLEGGYLFGVNFKEETAVNAILKKAIGNGVKDFQPFSVVIGRSLQDEFSLYPHEKLMYIFTEVAPGGFAITPQIKRFKIAGVFHSGLVAYDKAYSYTDLRSVQKVLNMPFDQYSGIHIFSNNPRKDIIKLRKFLPESVVVRGWWQDNVNFFAAMKMEKTSLFIVLMLLILIASINIISSLLMTVMNRRSDIALLLSLGASKKEIKKVFLYLGITIGIAGIVTGIILGLTGIWVLGHFDIINLPKNVYPSTRLPLDLSLRDFCSIVFGAFVIVVLSSWYPAKKASEVDILTVLRNE
jgi:putative ABC transport system permease protein